MPRRPWGHRGQPTGLAKPGGTRAHRCSSVSACGGLGASPYASACALASGVIVWPPRARLRHGWREVWRGGVGWWRRVRPRVAALWACGWSPRATWAPASRAPGPYGRPAKPGGSSHSPCPGWERNRGGPRRQRPAVGMGQASCGRGRSRIGSHGSCRKRCAWAGCMRVNWRRRKPRPLPLRQGKPLRPGPPTGGRGTPGGAPAGPMPRPRPWRSHTRRSGIVAERRRTRRARRGRPAKTAPAPPESGSRLVVEVEGRRHPEADHGWTVLATTVRPAEGTAPEILQAYQDQTTTVEPGCRWSKPPAAIAPGWLEKPARMAALAMLTVIGLLVSRSMQRQVRR
jgi:hypothetical protein